MLHNETRRLINNARLLEQHVPRALNGGMREVEIWENERWAVQAQWKNGQANLKPGERRAWSRGRDGSSGVEGDLRYAGPDFHQPPLHSTWFFGYYSSTLTFPMEQGWAFVETEDWQPDFLGLWANGKADPGAS